MTYSRRRFFTLIASLGAGLLAACGRPASAQPQLTEAQRRTVIQAVAPRIIADKMRLTPVQIAPSVPTVNMQLRDLLSAELMAYEDMNRHISETTDELASSLANFKRHLDEATKALE